MVPGTVETESQVCVRGMSKYYGDLPAVRGLSFELSEGEVLGIVGPSGAGKSTILRILAGSLTYSSGEVTVLGFDPMLNSSEVWRRVGYYPDRLDLFQYTTVEGAGRGTARKRGVDFGQALDEAREKWDLQDLLGRQILDLVEFDRRRAVLWCCSVGDPPLLLLDEPARDLVSREREEFVGRLRAAFQGRTGIITSESVADAWPVCTRILAVSGGEPAFTAVVDRDVAG